MTDPWIRYGGRVVGAITMTELRLGSDGGGASPMSGYLGACAMWRGVFDAGRIGQLESFLNRDWNLGKAIA